MKKIALIIILFVLAIGLVIVFKNDDSFIKSGGLYINEILASNNYTYKDSDGEYSDYIEIYNSNDYDINLEGYRLTDSLYEVNKWRFPNVTIHAKEYLVIFASSKNKCKESTKCHVNFKLSSEGETISLIDDTGNIISRVSFGKMKNDTSLSFVNGKYLVTKPTPGKENSKEEVKDIDISKYKIKINEYLTHNKGVNYNSNGEYSDWLELYNEGDDISLVGLSLSDEEKNLNKFMLPDKTIKKGEYVIIYLNGGKSSDGISANFKLSDNDKKIILSGDGKIIDSVDIVKLDKNMSYGLKDGKWLYFYTPTPGRKNNTKGLERIDKNGNT